MKVGLIGCGRWGRNHAEKLAALNCDFLGIADTDPNVREIVESHRTKYFADYRDLVERSDAVVIASPTNLHHEIARYALETGKHVFVEKPAAETAEEVSELCRIAHGRDLVLNTGYLFRFNPAVQELRRRLQEVEKIIYIKATNIHARPARKDSGVIINLGVHPLDVILFLTQERPSGVTCMAPGSPGAEKAAQIGMAYDSYVAIVETACEAQGLRDKKIQVVGEEATLEADFLGQTLTKYVQDEPPELWRPPEKVDLVEAELRHFLECTEDESMENIGVEDVVTAQVCDAALRSATKRNWEALE